MQMLKAKKGFSVMNVVFVVVGIIIVVAVAIPITTSVVDVANFSPGSTNATIAAIIPTLLLVGVILLVVSLYQG